MKLSITMEGGVIQSIDADEPAEIVIYYCPINVSGAMHEGEKIFKSIEDDDCLIEVWATGKTAKDRIYSTTIYDHAIKQMVRAKGSRL